MGVGFGLSLQEDFQGNSTYDAAARFVLSEITQPGGEWVWDLQVGETSLVSTEVYLPLSDTSSFFLLPHVKVEAKNVFLLEGQSRLAEYRVRSFDYGADFGREFGNWGEIRAGVQHESGSERVRVGDPTCGQTAAASAPCLPSDTFDTRAFFLRMSYDRLDSVNFPRRGQQAKLEWRAERIGLGSDQSYDQLSFNYLAAQSYGRYTGVFSVSGGTILNAPPGLMLASQMGLSGQPRTTPSDLRLLFPLGGFFNLSGLKANSLAGPHYGIARALFYKQIGRGGPGYLDIPTYLGMSLEMGNVWNHRSDVSFGNTRRDASVFLGLDTLLGPVYLATGFDDKGQQAFYLFLGRTF